MEPNVTLLKTSDHLGGKKVMYRNYMLEIKMKHWRKKVRLKRFGKRNVVVKNKSLYYKHVTSLHIIILM